MDLRSEVTASGAPKPLELSIPTRSLEQARRIWPEATEQDVGDIKLHFDPADSGETFAAKLAYEAAVQGGGWFFVLRDGESLEGELVPPGATFAYVLDLAREAAAAPPGGRAPAGEGAAEPEPAPQQATAAPPRRGRQRIQGVPRMSGG
jgi:hypothetical protein